MYCSSSYGPAFGGGNDLNICDNSNISANSYSNLGFSYDKLGITDIIGENKLI